MKRPIQSSTRIREQTSSLPSSYEDPPALLCSKAAIEDVQSQNLICILDVDIQGVRRIKETDLNPIYISIQPPSMEILVSLSMFPQLSDGPQVSSRLFSIRKSV